ncbi:MAG: LysM peptidoglycan-binding domain-containing protein [Rhodobacterales bacterium]|nr:MAG: LysM peptidoglycan-binding domain-containing protein [Rhodobacterales bacterium]
MVSVRITVLPPIRNRMVGFFGPASGGQPERETPMISVPHPIRCLLPIALVALSPLAAAAQEACTTYTVQAGDTLGDIAFTAYGSYNYQMIFNANREAIANNTNNLPVGLQLILPCEDGRLTADSTLNSVIETENERFEENRSEDRPYAPALKFVTSNNWKPFADESLPGGGIYVQMAATAMRRGGNDRDYKVDYVDDWDAHIDVLLPTNAFDISIAWSKPDCSKMDLLGEFGVRMCTEFVFSVPMYEVAYSYHTLVDSPYANARKFTDYEGARICRPEGWAMSNLEVEGLVPPLVTFVQPKSPMDCAEMLLNGEVDVYSIEIETSTANFEELGATNKVALNPAITSFNTHHFLTSKNNPRGQEYIAMLNRGIEEMRASGEWYDIVATGLADFNAPTN